MARAANSFKSGNFASRAGGASRSSGSGRSAMLPSDRRPSQANNQGSLLDAASQLAQLNSSKTTRAQAYANAGDSLPVVFCKRRGDNTGGVWISPLLVDAVSKNFERTFVYLIGQGDCGEDYDDNDVLTGNTQINLLSPPGFGAPEGKIVYSLGGSCPLSGTDATCDKNTFRYAIDSLGTERGDSASYRVVGAYATSITFRLKPINAPANTANYDRLKVIIVKYGPGGFFDEIETVASIDTEIDDQILEATDGSPGDGFTYGFFVTAITEDNNNRPSTILLEVEQSNNWPQQGNAADAYRDTSFLVLEGNMYNVDASYSDPDDLQQVNMFVKNGIKVNKRRNGSTLYGSSDLIPDLLNWFVEKSGNFQYADIPDDQLDLAIAFTSTYKMTYNGIITGTTNFLAWAQETSPKFLLGFHAHGAEYQLKPVIPVTSGGTIDTGGLTPVEAFSDTAIGTDNVKESIIAGSYRKTYINAQRRKPFQAVVTWRDQDDHAVETVKTTVVRFSDHFDTVPEESFDLSGFASNEDHAVLFAKYILATRRYSTHVISFTTARNVTSPNELGMYDLIEVEMHRVNSAGDNVTETDHYLVSSIIANGTGLVEIQAEHFPLSGSVSVINNQIVNGSFAILS